ncbi:MAG: helix-turn-helix transcriptional regulator [Actinomycetota bacterium]|nr:helix-turn-helix transcriptional regulator [Actinomycetota bacterium]MDP9484429.1 helix-turn-helix transcriptional regulator [Actinomycetota bacterium]
MSASELQRKKLAEFLRELRFRSELSIRGLADLTGLSTRTIVDAESGGRMPRERTVKAILWALNAPPHVVREAAVLMGVELPEGEPATPRRGRSDDDLRVALRHLMTHLGEEVVAEEWRKAFGHGPAEED